MRQCVTEQPLIGGQGLDRWSGFKRAGGWTPFCHRTIKAKPPLSLTTRSLGLRASALRNTAHCVNCCEDSVLVDLGTAFVPQPR
jgi:hypothetical protein